MRLPLLLLVLAALFSWASLQFETLQDASNDIVTATRSSAPTNAAAQTTNASETAAVAPGPPLFRPAVHVSDEPQPGESFALVGLAGQPGARIAFLRDEANGRTFTARVGDDVQGWTLERTEERCVVIRRGRRHETVCIS